MSRLGSDDDNVIRAGDYVIVRSYDDKSSYIVLCEGEKKINKSRISMKEIVGHHYDQIFELNNRKFHAVSVAEQIATEYYDPNIDVLRDNDPNSACTNAVSSHSVLQHNVDDDHGTDSGIDRIKCNRVEDGDTIGSIAARSVLDSEDIAVSSSTTTTTTLQYINNISLRGNNSYYTDTNTAQKLSNEDIKRLKEQGLSGKDIIQNLIDHSDTFASKNEYAQEKWLKKKDNKYRRKYKVCMYCM